MSEDLIRRALNKNENNDEERIYVIGWDGKPRLISITRETVEINQMGERRYVRHKAMIQSSDGRIIDRYKPQVYDCTWCSNRFLSNESIRFCEKCKSVICLGGCAKLLLIEKNNSVYFCPPCFRQTRIKQLFQFFFSTRIR